jgi:hypothetical protein
MARSSGPLFGRRGGADGRDGRSDTRETEEGGREEDEEPASWFVVVGGLADRALRAACDTSSGSGFSSSDSMAATTASPALARAKS